MSQSNAITVKSKALFITHVEGEGKLLKFWAVPEHLIKQLHNLERSLAERYLDLDSHAGFNESSELAIGTLICVKSRIKRHWCRARVERYSGQYEIIIKLIDYGNREMVTISDVREVDQMVYSLEPLAIECILADVVPFDDNTEWSSASMDFCNEHILFNSLSGYIVTYCQRIPVIRLAKMGVIEPLVQKMINNGLAGIEQHERAVVAAKTIYSGMGYKTVHLDPTFSFCVVVCHVENPEKFYVQISAADMERKSLMDSIKKYINQESLLPVNPALIKTPCLAPFMGNKMVYYRAIIMGIQNRNCKVFSVDYGHSDITDIHELRAIPTCFLSLPVQAIECSLPDNVNVDKETFSAATNGKTLSCVISSFNRMTYVVRLLHNGRDIFEPYPQHSIAPSFQYYNILDLKVGMQLDVNVSHINNPLDFYCQLASEKEVVDSVLNELNSGIDMEHVPVSDLISGCPVIAKFSEDNSWYRAKVVSGDSMNSIKVFFVDYGNSEVTTYENIRKLPQNLVRLPIQAFKCSVLPIEAGIEEFFVSLKDMFENLVDDKVLSAEIRGHSKEKIYTLDLTDPSDSRNSINSKIIQCASNPLIALPTLSNVENVIVCGFSPPNSFFGQLTKFSDSELGILQEAINAKYANLVNTSYSPSSGNYVCAKFSEDGRYYRGKIESCVQGLCQVLFVDHGGREIIQQSYIHKILPNFTELPQFAIECVLQKCDASIPADKLRDVMLLTEIQINVIGEQNGKFLVSLTEEYTGNAPVLEVLGQRETVSTYGRTYPTREVAHTSVVDRGRAELRQYDDSNYGRNESVKQDFSVPKTFKSRSFQNSSHISLRSDSSSSFKNPKSPPRNKSSPEHQWSNNDHSERNIPKSASSSENHIPSSKISASYTCLTVQVGVYKDIYVSYVKNPSEFYCQLMEERPKLVQLMESIAQKYCGINQNEKQIKQLEKGMPCCVIYSEDSCWYRGKIVSVFPSSGSSALCDVLFVDYGNTEKVPISGIKQLNSEFLSLPIQSLKCALFNTLPVDGAWSTNNINTFTEMTLEKCHVAKFEQLEGNATYLVNLISINQLQEDILNKKFVTSGHGRFIDEKKLLVLDSQVASTNLTFEEIPIALETTEKVEVTWIQNPGEFYCQLCSSSAAFKKMMSDMQNHYKNATELQGLIDRPSPGMICVAQFSEDHVWYRGRVISLDKNVVQVYYVDYGNSEMVPKKQVRYISQDFTILPAQGIRCRLMGIKPCGNSWIIPNERTVSGYFEGDCMCTFVNKYEDYFSVDLKRNGKSVAEEIVHNKLALFTSTVPSGASELSHSISKYCSIPQNDLPTAKGTLINVVVTLLDSPQQFWCKSLENSELLDDVMTSIEVKYASNHASMPKANPDVDSACIALYSEDENWYRAVIKSCPSPEQFEVYFVDYGNTEVVDSSLVKVIDPEFMELPAQAFECKLYGLPSSYSQEAAEMFESISDKEDLIAKVDAVENGIFLISLYESTDSSEVNILESIFGVNPESHCKETESAIYPTFPKVEVPIGTYSGYVSVVKNPHCFYVHLSDHENELSEFSSQLSEKYESIPEGQGTIQEVHIGMACCAKFSEDDLWYRAEVSNISDGTASVLFVDYGNIDIVPVNSLRTLEDEFLGKRPFAIPCMLSGIKPHSANWSEDAIEEFEGTTADALVSITFSVNELPASVAIKLEQDNIADKLVSMELGVRPFKMYDKRELLDNTDVKLSYVHSLEEFYVSAVDLENQLEVITLKLEEIHLEECNEKPLSPQTLMPCVAKYSDDGNWYRAVVISCDETSITVLFVDFGNKEVISEIANLKPLAPELLKIPPIAVECSLFGIQATEGEEENVKSILDEYISDEVVFRLEVVEKQKSYKIKLKSDCDLSEHLVKEGVACKNILTEEERNVSIFPVRYPERLLSSKAIVKLSSVYSVEKLFVTPVELSNTLDSIATIFEAKYDDTSGLEMSEDELQAMMPCAAKFSASDAWYRAAVTEFCDGKVNALFVDYGNSEVIELSNVKHLVPELLEIPPIAIECGLFNVQPIEGNEEQIKMSLQALLDDDIQLELDVVEKGETYKVKLKNDSELNEQFINDGLATYCMLPSNKADLEYGNYPEREIHSKFTVRISYVHEMGKFYVTPSELLEELDFITEQMEVFYDSESGLRMTLDKVRNFQPCAAKYSTDGVWYRAVVTNHDGADVTVSFVDFGNTDVTSMSDLRLLSSELLKIPPVAVECSLFGVQPVEGKEGEIKCVLETLMSSETELEIDIIDHHEPYKVKLRSDVDISEHLVEAGLAYHCTPSSEILQSTDTFKENLRIAFLEELPEEACKNTITPRCVSVEKLTGNIKHVETFNGQVMLHLVPCELENDLAALQEKLQSVYAKPDCDLQAVSEPGPCAAKLAEDECWYRGLGVPVEGKDCVLVKFVDFGFSRSVSTKDVSELLPEFLSESQYTICLSLSGVKVLTGKEELVETLISNLVEDREVVVQICGTLSYEKSIYRAIVNIGEVDIAEVLVQESVVVQVFPPPSPPEESFQSRIEKVEGEGLLFHIIPINWTEARNILQKELQEAYENKEPCEFVDINCNFLYAVKKDTLWFRASVLSTSEDSVVVSYADLGITESVLSSRLQPLDPLFWHRPPLILQCLLHGLLHPLDQGHDFIWSHVCDENILMCKVQEPLSRSEPFSVSLSVNGIDILSELQDQLEGNEMLSSSKECTLNSGNASEKYEEEDYSANDYCHINNPEETDICTSQSELFEAHTAVNDIRVLELENGSAMHKTEVLDDSYDSQLHLRDESDTDRDAKQPSDVEFHGEYLHHVINITDGICEDETLKAFNSLNASEAETENVSLFAGDKNNDGTPIENDYLKDSWEHSVSDENSGGKETCANDSFENYSASSTVTEERKAPLLGVFKDADIYPIDEEEQNIKCGVLENTPEVDVDSSVEVKHHMELNEQLGNNMSGITHSDDSSLKEISSGDPANTATVDDHQETLLKSGWSVNWNSRDTTTDCQHPVEAHEQDSEEDDFGKVSEVNCSLVDTMLEFEHLIEQECLSENHACVPEANLDLVDATLELQQNSESGDLDISEGNQDSVDATFEFDFSVSLNEQEHQSEHFESESELDCEVEMSEHEYLIMSNEQDSNSCDSGSVTEEEQKNTHPEQQLNSELDVDFHVAPFELEKESKKIDFENVHGGEQGVSGTISKQGSNSEEHEAPHCNQDLSDKAAELVLSAVSEEQEGNSDDHKNTPKTVTCKTQAVSASGVKDNLDSEHSAANEQLASGSLNSEALSGEGSEVNSDYNSESVSIHDHHVPSQVGQLSSGSECLPKNVEACLTFSSEALQNSGLDCGKDIKSDDSSVISSEECHKTSDLIH